MGPVLPVSTLQLQTLAFLLLEGVWPELLLQELSGKTELYVHFPM